MSKRNQKQPIGPQSTLQKFRTKTFTGKQAKYDSVHLVGKNQCQIDHIRSLNNQESITIACGPAGTGKTYVSVVHAIDMLIKDKIEKIYIIRPNVQLEGENELGALPGDINEKLSPVLKPMIDVLEDYFSSALLTTLLRTKVIEIVPIQFIRGNNFSNSVVICDEAQNLSKSGMKAMLTRGSENCKIIVTGDTDQADRDPEDNGLLHAINVLDGAQYIDIIKYTTEDVVRSPVVKSVLENW